MPGIAGVAAVIPPPCIRPRVKPVPIRRRALMKAIFVWSPFRFPHGVPTNPMHDPRADGTKPSEFARDLARAVAALKGIASSRGNLEPTHGTFGTMTLAGSGGRGSTRTIVCGSSEQFGV